MLESTNSANTGNTLSRRGNPAPYLKTLRKMKKSDWEALVAHCIMALVSKQTTIHLRFSHLVKFPEGFPQGSRIDRIGRDDIWEIGTKNMMRWLIKNGHTSIDMYQLQQTQRKITMLCDSMDRMFLDEPVEYDKVWIDELLEENDE